MQKTVYFNIPWLETELQIDFYLTSILGVTRIFPITFKYMVYLNSLSSHNVSSFSPLTDC